MAHTSQLRPRRRQRRPHPNAFPELEPFAARLEMLRLDRMLTQRVLAARAKISPNHYQDIAHARANPTVIVLLNLARALGVSLAALLEDMPESDAHRTVSVTDLRELADASQQLGAIVKRVTRASVDRK